MVDNANSIICSYTTQVLRIVTPILKGQRKSVEVKPEKEKEYHERLQLEIEKTVWATSCASVSTYKHSDILTVC